MWKAGINAVELDWSWRYQWEPNIFSFLWPYPRHVAVPGQGAYTTAGATLAP